MRATASNPFFHRGPVRDPAYFFGREHETSFVADLLRQRQSVAVSGPRRVGKTSLLFHLAHPEIAGSYRLGPDSTCWVYVDGGMLDGLAEEWFYGAVDRALGGEADALPYPQFVVRLRDLAAQNLRVILAIDEFELIAANPLFGRELFNRLRGLMAQFGLQCVTASKTPLVDLTFAHSETLSSPFFNMFAPLHLPLFTEDASMHMLATLSVRSGHPFTSQTLRLLYDLTGPQPLFLQVAGYRAFAMLVTEPGQVELSASAFATVRSQTLTDLEPHLRYAWNTLDPQAQYTLAALPFLTTERATQPIKQLMLDGLLHNATYVGSALEDFVRRQPVAGLLQMGDFVLDTRRGLAAVRGRIVHLTPTELGTLRLFLEHPGQLLTPAMLEAGLWPDEIAPDPERARGVVKKLRAALGPAGNAIVNRRGQGYLLATGWPDIDP
jgi:hypothetical protein